MIDIVIEYRPFGILRPRKVLAALPESWRELKQDQLIALHHSSSTARDQVKLLCSMLNLRKRIVRRLDSFQRFSIIRLISFLDKPSPIDRFLVKSIAGYKAPKPRLKDFPFGVFIYADTKFTEYLAGRTGALNRFIACFYLPEEGFNEDKLEDHARRIGSVDIATRVAIANNYVMIREWLEKVHPLVFQKDDSPRKGRAVKDPGWLKVLDLLAFNDLVNYDAYAKLPTNTVLRYLNGKLKEHYRNESKQIQQSGRVLRRSRQKS